MALLMSAVCLVANAHAIDNSDIENFFNLSPDEQGNIISYYINHNKQDSAMLYANMQATYFCSKDALSNEESRAVCAALNYLGQVYSMDYSNYQLSAKYLYK